MSSSELRRLYSGNDHGVGEATGILTILHRKILRDLRLRDSEVLANLERWLQDPTSGIPQTPKHRTQARGNYIKKMIEPAMSWRSFMDMIQMLYPAKVKITIDFTWDVTAHGTRHSVEIDLSHRLNRNPYLTKIGETPPDLTDYNASAELSEEDQDKDNDDYVDLGDTTDESCGNDD